MTEHSYVGGVFMDFDSSITHIGRKFTADQTIASSLVTTFLLFSVLWLCRSLRYSKFPIINDKKFWELSDSRLRTDFALNGRKIFEAGLKSVPKKPFQIFSDFGLVTILPPEYAKEIKNDPRADFGKHTSRLMMADYPGFETFKDTGSDLLISLDVIRLKLTQALAKLTKPLSEECTTALHDILKDDREWRKVCVKENILQLVARLSSRVFLGKEVCRNPAWLKITVDYTVNAFLAAEELRLWNPILRPIAHWFLPRCTLLRAQVKDAHNVIIPVLEKRRAEKATRLSEGREAIEFDDAIEWFETISKGRRYNPVNVQLGLSVAAIHTTTDLITQVVLDLAQHPELIKPLRQEIISVLTEGGWKKTSLYKLKLLDSVIKESQRLKPISTISMRREVTSTIKLSDGTILQRGSDVGVSSHRMWDPTVHRNPLEYDGLRFLKMRQEPGRENAGQLVSTGPDHLAFGYGQHACPGRFFAANETKIALIHLLMKYDWRLPEGEAPTVREFGFSLNSDPLAKLEIRRRQEELDL